MRHSLARPRPVVHRSTAGHRSTARLALLPAAKWATVLHMPDSTDLAPPCTLVIFGASGDLTARKLVPAIERLATFDRLPESFALVGVARSPMTDEEFRSRCRDAAK